MRLPYLAPLVVLSLQAQETPRLEVVTEWVRELAAFRAIQVTGLAEMKEGNDRFMDAIRNGTRVKLELRTSMAILGRMKVTQAPFDQLLPNVITCYERKLALHDEFVQIAKQMVGGVPQPGVDYGKLVARAPEITASLEAVDDTLFHSTVLFVALLIDEKANSRNQCDHMLLTNAERKALADRIQGAFGSSLTENGQNYNVSSAVVLFSYLTGSHKSADDPWD